jgi:hypothetical protein
MPADTGTASINGMLLCCHLLAEMAHYLEILSTERRHSL